MIEVSKHYAIDSDGERNFIILKKSVSKKDGTVTWTNFAYHGTLFAALQSILNKESKSFVASREGKDLKQVIKDLMEFENNLGKEMMRAFGKGDNSGKSL